MNRDSCVDKKGISHFGEYGWYDGYCGSLSNCRVKLEARGNCCEDVDDCVTECMKKISEGKTNTNIVSQNIQNMKNGEITRSQEEKEDKEISIARRKEEQERLAKEKEEEELGGKKVRVVEDSESKETWICPYCEKEIGEKELYQDKEGKWYHRPCIGRGPIVLPTSKKEIEPEKVGEVSPSEETIETEKGIHFRIDPNGEEYQVICGPIFEKDEISKRVVKRGNKWCVVHAHPKKPGSTTDKEPGTVIKCFPTKKEAEEMHRAILISQAREAGKI